MASLPEVTLDPVQGTPPPDEGVAPTDFGLGQAGQELAHASAIAQRAAMINIRAQAQADKDKAAPILEQLSADNAKALATDAATYTGAPGFAQDQIAKAKARSDALLTTTGALDMAPGVHAELARGVDQENLRLGAKAFSVQTAAQVQPIIEAQQNSEAAQVGAGLTAFNADFGPAQHALLTGHMPGDTDLVAKTSAQFDASSAKAVASVPAYLQPTLQGKLLSLKPQVLASAQDLQMKSAEQGVLDTTAQSVSTTANSIATAPTSYDTAVAGIPTLVSALPAPQRDGAARDAAAQYATARINGLIQQDHADVASEELKAGKYDAILTPPERDALGAKAEAAARESGPEAIQKAIQAASINDQADQDAYLRATTGHGLPGFSLGAAAGILSGEQIGALAVKGMEADRVYAATGPIKSQTDAQLAAMAHAPQPALDPKDAAGNAKRLEAWQLQQKAAQAELQARQQPGTWLWGSKAPANNAAADAGSPDLGSQLKTIWGQIVTGNNPNPGGLAGDYVGAALKAQQLAGIPADARQLIPQTEASALAAGVTNAPPEGKLAAMQALARLVKSFPTTATMPDGSTNAPQAMLAKQLVAAGMSPAQVSAVVDLGDGDPHGVKLGRYVAAINDPTLKTPEKKGEAAGLALSVRAYLGPYLASVEGQPGEQSLAQARIDRTTLIAREIMATEHLTPDAAAKAAAADLTGAYRFSSDGWRMPANAANAGSFIGKLGGMDGMAEARFGTAQLLSSLTANDGAGLGPPAGVDPKTWLRQVSNSGRWVTKADDTGLRLMVPHADGQWDVVADRYGRPVEATWAQLQSPDGGGSIFAKPPANVVRQADGTPVRAYSRAEGVAAVDWAVEYQESRFKDGLVSPKGALGRMQIMPDTGRLYAAKLGLVWDPDRALHDDAYNRQIGQAAFADLVGHYGNGAGLGLALAAYNAGPGRLDGYTDQKGYHPGWLQTIGDPRTGKISLDDFVERIPYAETRDYVKQVLSHALTKLQGQH